MPQFSLQLATIASIAIVILFLPPFLPVMVRPNPDPDENVSREESTMDADSDAQSPQHLIKANAGETTGSLSGMLAALKWILILAGGISVIGMFVNYSKNPPDLFTAAKLEVTVTWGDLLGVQNIGTDTVTINDIRVNDRDDCYAVFPSLPPFSVKKPDPFEPRALKVGDQASFGSNCQIVRVTINTSEGDLDFEFK
jgi:hypothetical protein